MPNQPLNKEPQYDGEIDANIIDVFVSEVNGKGWAHASSKYGHHHVAWAPFCEDGKLRTTSYNQNEKKRVQSFIQKSDGNVNIGTEEWAGDRVVILVLDETLDT